MDFSSNFFTNLIAGISLFVSSITIFLYFSDRKRVKFQILTEYTKQLLDWHGSTVEILIKLRLYSENKGDFNKTELLSNLSCQIEKGRFFFPNIILKDDFGSDKQIAYQGYRNLTLDFLVYSYNLFSQENASEYIKHAKELQREFTSIVFEILRPKENLDEIRKLTDKYFTKEHIFENYLEKKPEAVRFMHKY
jgi:hypothetical protein